MAEQLTEVCGVITHLKENGSYAITVALRDNEGRILSIGYHFHSGSVCDSIKDSLSKGMTVKCYVTTPISPTTVSYTGSGLITVLADSGPHT